MTARGSIGCAALLSIATLFCPAVVIGAQQETQAAPAGQTTPPPGYSTTVFKANVRRVVVDVVVTDSKGQPVSGLTRQDFSVSPRDGKQQQILSFDANGFSPAMDYLPPNLPRAPKHICKPAKDS